MILNNNVCSVFKLKHPTFYSSYIALIFRYWHFYLNKHLEIFTYHRYLLLLCISVYVSFHASQKMLFFILFVKRCIEGDKFIFSLWKSVMKKKKGLCGDNLTQTNSHCLNELHRKIFAWNVFEKFSFCFVD